MCWRRPKINIHKDLISLIEEKSLADNKSPDIIVDELLRRQLIEGPIYRCPNCHNVCLKFEEKTDNKMLGFCNYCDIYVSVYET